MTDTLIRDVRLVDGTGAPAADGQAVVVEGRRIAWRGPVGSAPTFRPEDVIEGQGRTLLPGLVNAHVHLVMDAGPDPVAQMVADSVPTATLRATNLAAATLASGVTTVRDCGAADEVVIELGKAIDDGLVEGPRVVAAGRALTMTGGHGWFVGREADGPDAMRRAVRQELKLGAHFIKLMATGGVLTPGSDPSLPALTPDELVAAVDEAHRAGRRTTAHAIGTAGIAAALRAGIDSLEHAMRLDDATLELALDRSAYIVPTIVAITSIVEAGVAAGVPADVVAKAEREAENSRRSFVAAVDSGLRIAAGTDAGTSFNAHDALPRELATMVEYGMSPMQALVAATRNAAENLDVDHRVGTVAVGKDADLLLVDGRPDESIGDISRVVGVWRSGRRVAAAVPR